MFNLKNSTKIENLEIHSRQKRVKPTNFEKCREIHPIYDPWQTLSDFGLNNPINNLSSQIFILCNFQQYLPSALGHFDFFKNGQRKKNHT